MTRQWNEPPTVENDRKLLARHLVDEHGANEVATHAAHERMLRDIHDEYHAKPVPA
jgi:hypothetical protein